mgnify:CR=1 FL=1
MPFTLNVLALICSIPIPPPLTLIVKSPIAYAAPLFSPVFALGVPLSKNVVEPSKFA